MVNIHFYSKLLFIAFFFSLSCLNAKLYFIHIPKTGGTTLRSLLEQQLSAGDIYPYRIYGNAKGKMTQALISGHFPYWFCQSMDADFEQAFKVTILRDPIERYLSFLRAKKKAERALPSLEAVLKCRESKEKKYSFGLLDNALCRNLSTDPSLEGEDLLESAKETLHKLDCVLFFENYTEEVIELFCRLGIDLKEEDIPKLNTTQPEQIPLEVYQKVVELNQQDIQLYEYAKKYIQKKTTQYSLRTSSFDQLLQKTKHVSYTFDLPLPGRGWTYRDDVNGNPFCRWVTNQPAYIDFFLEEGCDYQISFRAHLLHQEVLPQLAVNGQAIGLHRCDSEAIPIYRGTISSEMITSAPTKIMFYSPNSFEYRQIHPARHNRNHPPLSFAVDKIEIEPILVR